MKKSIYEIYVPVTSQQQADRLKAICVKYGLPIWEDVIAFELFTDEDYFFFGKANFAIYVLEKPKDKTPITESEFELLAKEFKQ
jgi:hypothetical protein